MRIDRRWLTDLWHDLTGDLVSLRIVPQDAAYWGEVWEVMPGLVRLRLREDLANHPREFLKTFLHELAHRANGDTKPQRQRRYQRGLEGYIALMVDHNVKETWADQDAEILLRQFEQRLAAAGLGWDDVTIDVGEG